MSDVVIRVENISKLYRLGEVGTGSLAHDVNRWWHRVRGKEDPYLKIGEVNDRTKSVSSVQSPESSAKKTKRNLTTTEHRGRCEMEQPKVGPKGEEAGASESKGEAGLTTDDTDIHGWGRRRATLGQAKLVLRFQFPSQGSLHGNVNLEPRITGMDTDNRRTQGDVQVTCAGASEPDSLTSKLADSPVSESLIRSTDGPTSALDTGHLLPATALRAPYFMHPSVYHRGLHKSRLPTRHSQPVTRHSAEGVSP